MPWKLCADIYNDLQVIALTDKQTNKQTQAQTDNTENNTTLAARVMKSLYSAQPRITLEKPAE